MPPDEDAADPRISERLDLWVAARNYVAVGNLGEQIAARLLLHLDYQLLGGQDDFVGMVSEVLGEATSDNPEDMIAIDPQGRLVTVNSKATVSPRSCRIKRDGNLTNPRMGRGQSRVGYSTRRANLVSPLDGDSFAQVVKVDLRNSKAQAFEVADDGRLSTVSEVFDVSALLAEVMAAYPGEMPPPSVWELVE
jgi:hypothetical protein